MREYSLEVGLQEDIEYVDEQLSNFNESIKPYEQDEEFHPFQYITKNESDEIIAGISAYAVMWKILYVDVLWVHESYRNQGIGSSLLAQVEKDAKEFGCKVGHLDSFDFQGKGFYEKQGYQIFGTLEDAPEGHKEYFFSKKL